MKAPNSTFPDPVRAGGLKETLATEQYLSKIQRVLAALDRNAIARYMKVLERAYAENRLVLIAGNGGSAATASHMAVDLAKTVAFEPEIPGFRAVSLSDNSSLMTAIGNDVGFDAVFACQLRRLGRAGDVLIVVSGSGNSPNIVAAIDAARELGMIIVALLGKQGGRARGLADVEVIVPSDEYGPIEDAHLVLNHLVTAYFRQSLVAAAGVQV